AGMERPDGPGHHSRAGALCPHARRRRIAMAARGSVTLIDRRRETHASSGGADGEPPMQLYSKRKQIYPKLVHGRIRNVKWAVMIASLAIYYGLPWLRWDRGPD